MRSDYTLPQRKIITIRYRDKYVDLATDSEHYATMTQNAEGDRIEFDFSMCRVIGVREIWPIPVIEDENAPPNGVLVTREQLNEAARQTGDGRRDEPKNAGGEVLQ